MKPLPQNNFKLWENEKKDINTKLNGLRFF